MSLSHPVLRPLTLLDAIILGILAISTAGASEPRSLGGEARLHPCPSTGHPTGACPGYVKDHVVPLACGGPDAVANLQWQTTSQAKAKDRWERKACAR